MQDKDKFVPWWKSSLDVEATVAAFAFKVYNLNSIKWFSLWCVAQRAFVNSMVFADHSCLNRQSQQKYLQYLDTTYGRGKKLHIHTFQFNSLQASLLSFAQKTLTLSLAFFFLYCQWDRINERRMEKKKNPNGMENIKICHLSNQIQIG